MLGKCISRVQRIISGGRSNTLNTLKSIVTIIFQLLVGYALAFGIVLLTQATNGWEAAGSGIGSIVGVWLVGSLSHAMQSSLKIGRALTLFIGTLLGGLAGTLIIVVLGTTTLAFVGLFFIPLLGALIGYYGFPALLEMFTR